MSLFGPEEVGPNNSKGISKEVDALFEFVCQVQAPSLSKKISFATSVANLVSELRRIDLPANSLQAIRIEADELFTRVARSSLLTKVIIDPPLSQGMWQSFLEDFEEIIDVRRARSTSSGENSETQAAVKLLVSQIVSLAVSQLDLELKIAIKNRVNESDPSSLKPTPKGMGILEQMIVNRIHFLIVFEGIINSGKSEVGGIEYTRGVNNLVDLIFFGINSQHQQYAGASIFATFKKLFNANIAQSALKAYKTELLDNLDMLDINQEGIFTPNYLDNQFHLPLDFTGITDALPNQEPLGFLFERIEHVLVENPQTALELARILRTLPAYLTGKGLFESRESAAHGEEILKGVALIWENSSANSDCIAKTLEMFRSDSRTECFTKIEKRAIQELALSLSYQEKTPEIRSNIATICRYL